MITNLCLLRDSNLVRENFRHTAYFRGTRNSLKNLSHTRRPELAVAGLSLFECSNNDVMEDYFLLLATRGVRRERRKSSLACLRRVEAMSEPASESALVAKKETGTVNGKLNSVLKEDTKIEGGKEAVFGALRSRVDGFESVPELFEATDQIKSTGIFMLSLFGDLKVQCLRLKPVWLGSYPVVRHTGPHKTHKMCKVTLNRTKHGVQFFSL